MLRTVCFAALLGLGSTLTANAAVTPTLPGDALLTKVAEGCGPGFWRGPGGRCHPYAVNRACPRGYHLGPEGRRCWPN